MPQNSFGDLTPYRGDRYTTSVEASTPAKDTSFMVLISRQGQLEPDPNDDRIFVDRKSKISSYALDYLRTDLVSDNAMNNKSVRQSLIVEAINSVYTSLSTF